MRKFFLVASASLFSAFASAASYTTSYSNSSIFPSTPRRIGTGSGSSHSSISSGIKSASNSWTLTATTLSSSSTLPLGRNSSIPFSRVNVTSAANSSWASVESCNAAWQTYSKDYITTSAWPAVITDIYSYWDYFPPANATPYTTLCDGTPRAHGRASWDYRTKTDISNYTSTSLITNFNAPTPTCSINSIDCGRLWYSQDEKDPNPGCPSTCDGALYTTDYAGRPLPPCYIVADSLQLAYWPVTVEGSLCGNRSTITDGISSPRTASIWGTEITSPGVIVSFHSIWAIDNCLEPNTLGEVVTDYLLFQQTSQISTQCGAYHQGGGPGTQVNFADFNSPVPASAYSCMSECGDGVGGMENYCTTIYDNFNPQLAFPTDVFNIRPEWKSCKIQYLGNIVNDPPTALTEEKTPVRPTTPGDSGPTTPAKPAHPHSTPAKPTTTGHTRLPDSPTGGPHAQPADNHTPTKKHTANGGKPTKANHSLHNNSPGGNNSPHEASPTGNKPATGNPAGVIVSILQHTTLKTGHNPVGGTPDPGNNSNGHDPAPNRDSDPGNSVITSVGSQAVRKAPEDPGAIIIGDSTTLQPGQSTRIDNTLVSVGTGRVVIDGTTLRIPATTGLEAISTTVLNVDGQQITATVLDSSGLVRIAGETLASGDIATVSGHTISDAGTALVVDGSETILISASLASARVTKRAVFTISGHVYTATELANGNIVVDGTTLRRDGPAATIDGVRVSDGVDGLVVGSRTVEVSGLSATKETSSRTSEGAGLTSATAGNGAGSRLDLTRRVEWYVSFLIIALLIA